MNIDKTRLYESFIDIKNIANLNILKCYKQLFSKKNIIYNIGSYIIILITILHIIYTLIFYNKQFDDIINKIKDIIYALKNIDLFNEEKIKKKETKENSKNNNDLVHNLNKKTIISKNIIKKSKKDKMNIKANKRKKNKNIIIENNKESGSNIKLNNNDLINKNIITSNINKDINNYNDLKNKEIKDKKIKKIKDIMEYKDEEKNKLSYDLAVQNDRRTYLEFYLSLLKTKHNLFFSFCRIDDYNSHVIKMNVFFMGFSIYYIINALFYGDETMNKIYEDKGSFNLIYQLPKIIYSSLISAVINKILKLLALSNDDIIKFKQEKVLKDITEKGNKLENKLKTKFVLYFILNFLFLLLFWYYLSMFGAIYKNTQLHLLKDTLISYGLSLFYPFVIYLLPGLFRIPALSNKKKDRKYLYKISQFLLIL